MHGVTLLPVALAMVFLAAIVRGFTGFGFSIAAVPLLSLITTPAQAVPVVLLLQALVSLSGLRAALRVCDWRSLRVLALGALVATPLGAIGLARLPAAPVRVGIAAIVLAAVLVLGRGVRMRVAPRFARVLPFGLLSGLCNGLVGMPGPPVIAFYLASPVETGVARASMIVFFLLTALLALVPLGWFGMVGTAALLQAGLGAPLVWLGSLLGARLYRASPERHYRPVALVLLSVTAGLAVVRAAVALGA